MRHIIITVGLFYIGCETPADSADANPVDVIPVILQPPSEGVELDTVIGTFNDEQITYGEVAEVISGQLVQMEAEHLNNRYAAESQALEQIIIERLIEVEASKRGIGVEALLKIEVDDKIVDPTEQEIVAAYQLMQRSLRNAPLDQVRDQVIGELQRRQQAEIGQAYLQNLKDSANVITSLPFPDLPRLNVSADDDPYRGNLDAPVTIVQFAEYQCLYCGRAGETLDQLMTEYEGQVRMVFRDFPLSFHDRAIPAAVAANCAGAQDKYWEMHTSLMSNQRSLADSDLIAHAQALGLDLEAWNTCRLDPSQEAEVIADMEDGARFGVTGTPAFFINGIMISGAQPYERFKEIIDRELSMN